jgi:hypothetical protein
MSPTQLTDLGMGLKARHANDLRPQGATEIPVRGLEALLLKFLSMDFPPLHFAAPLTERERRGKPWLHPTKGFRGPGTRPAGTNRRRIVA